MNLGRLPPPQPGGMAGSAAGLLQAGASAVLLVLALPKADLYPLVWIALVPLLTQIAQAPTLGRASLLSYISGFLFFAGTFYWITETMATYGGLDAVSSLGVGLLFCLFFALHFALFGGLTWLAVRKWGPRGLLSAAPFWVAVELIRTYVISGFPWMLMGYSLVPFPGILQIAAWTGVYGLSFIGASLNSVIAFGLTSRSLKWTAVGTLGALALSLLPLRAPPGEAAGDSIKVRIVQTNISLDQSWTEPDSGRLLDELSRMSSPAPGTVRLIVWPETPSPFYLREDPVLLSRLQGTARAANAAILLGYIDRTATGPTNSAGLVDGRDGLVSRYDKLHLVPFGEYVPFKDYLFFAESLTRQVGDFVPGKDWTLSALDGHRFSTVICYESVFPDLVRQFVKRGSELLVVITNDGWFGESSAPFQHLRMGVLRAVENHRYVVRAANTGISAIIDPYGRVGQATALGRRTAIDVEARFLGKLTFYTKYGDIFAYANALGAVALAAAAIRNRRKHVRGTHRSVRPGESS